MGTLGFSSLPITCVMFRAGFRTRTDRKKELLFSVVLGVFSGVYIWNNSAKEALSSKRITGDQKTQRQPPPSTK
jgi:hypothetical protein